MLNFIRSGCCRDENHLRNDVHELIEREGTVVHGARESEAVFNEGFFSRSVTRVLPANLWHSDVRFVNHYKHVFREIVKQRVGALSWLSSVQVCRVIFDARTDARLLHHFQVMFSSRAKSLHLEELSLFFELCQLNLQFFFNCSTSVIQSFRTCGVVRSRKQSEFLYLHALLLGHRIKESDLFNFVVKERDSNCFVAVGRLNFEGVALHAKKPAL